MNVLDLFSGIGGFSLGLERAGMKTVAFCEIEPFPQKVLKKHWPDVPIFEDIRNLHAEEINQPIDIICGGYPCQPFSQLGKRNGANDERHLWPEMLRLIQECSPSWVICENVVAHIIMGLDKVLSDLERNGYTQWTFVIPACAIDAPHKRDRIWIIANSNSIVRKTGETKAIFDSEGLLQKPQQWKQLFFNNHGNNNIEFRKETEPMLCRDDDGVSTELDESRLKALGNAVVPQIPEIIGRAIMQIENQKD